MSACLRSALMAAVLFIGVCPAVWAEDTPAIPNAPSSTSVSMPAPANEADQAVSEIGPIEDEEAPAEASPETTVEAEEQADNGPKTATDKLAEKFMELDVDESDGVSMDEYITIVQQRVMARFAVMDANGDGEVTEDEYRAFWKSRMAKWYRLQR